MRASYLLACLDFSHLVEEDQIFVFDVKLLFMVIELAGFLLELVHLSLQSYIVRFIAFFARDLVKSLTMLLIIPTEVRK